MFFKFPAQESYSKVSVTDKMMKTFGNTLEILAQDRYMLLSLKA